MNPPETKYRGAIAWMTRHSVAANLVMLFCLLGGLLMARQIKQEVFPEFTAGFVQVSMVYHGAGPEEVEQGIILAVEEAVMGLDGIQEVSSAAYEGLASVVIEVMDSYDENTVATDIRSAVDRITTFPKDAEPVQISVVSRKREALSIALYGDTTEHALFELAESARDGMLQDEDITSVDIVAVRPLEISINVSRQNLRKYGLTMQGVADRIASSSVELPGGGIKTSEGEILVRVKERRDYGRQFRNIPVISTPDGGQVLLGDIATITDGFEEVDHYARFNGKPAVILGVYRVGDQKPLQVAKAAKAYLATLQKSLPNGVQAEILRDRSKMYSQRLNLLVRNGMLGLAMVLLVLGLFLEVRLAFWVAMGIPISFLGAFLVFPATDMSINMISMFAFIIALGVVVDDAIVIGENIYHYRREGLPMIKASIRGAREMASPVTFSILTNVVTFLPLSFIPGIPGRIFGFIPLVVIVVFLISLFESIFILPAHLGHQREIDGPHGWFYAKQQAFSQAFERWVRERYAPFLNWVLMRRYLAIAVAVALMIVSVFYMATGRMGMSMFPQVESDYARAEVWLPYGADVNKTQEVMDQMLAGARKVVADSGHPELVTGIDAEVGREGSHHGRMTVYLADPDIRSEIMSTSEYTKAWRKAVGSVSGIDNIKFAADSGGPGHGAAVTVELSHRDISVLEAASAELAEQIATYPRVRDVDDGFQKGKRQLDFTITPRGQAVGLTPGAVGRQVRDNLYGAQVVRQQRGRNELKIMVRLPKEERIYRSDLGDMTIFTPAGGEIPLLDAVTVEEGRAYTSIKRRNGRRVVQVAADVTPKSKAQEVINALGANVLPELKQKHAGLITSFQGHQAEMAKSMSSLVSGFIIALLGVFMLLAIPFRSYSQPLIVMTAIPFGIVGAMVGHLIMGYSLSIPSMFGMVALSGVVVNDSLVLVDYANRQRRQLGVSAIKAVRMAGVQRFRAIILTTLTTFFGLAPMIVETDRAARFMIPMALSLGFGILFATGITLVLVPSLYMAVDDMHAWMDNVARGWRKIRSRKSSEQGSYTRDID